MLRRIEWAGVSNEKVLSDRHLGGVISIDGCPWREGNDEHAVGGRRLGVGKDSERW